MTKKVIGVPKDTNRFKTSGSWAGDDRCCVLWSDRNMFQVKLSFPDLAMIKFTVTFDKGTTGWGKKNPSSCYIFCWGSSMLKPPQGSTVPVL